MQVRQADRGAALIVAIAVMTILLAIALTFFTVTRLELKTATNVENTVRAELLADAATNIAISFLNQDYIEHPTFTSLDHAWRTYFNGAWVHQKRWAWPQQWYLGDAYPGMGSDEIPALFYTAEPNGEEPNNPSKSEPGGGGDGFLYIPRRENTAYPATVHIPGSYLQKVLSVGGAFAIDPAATNTSPVGLTPEEQVDRWADADVDGNGLKDAVWIPLVADTFAGSIVERDPADGSVIDVLVEGDHVDNDLDNNPQPRDRYLNEPDVSYNAYLTEFATTAKSAGIDEENETQVFLYDGSHDGLDNDARTGGAIDDDLERWFLTAPLCSIEAANDHYLILRGVDIPGVGKIDINSSLKLPWPDNAGQMVDGQHRWVDVLDNDYDQIRNKHMEYYTPAVVPCGGDCKPTPCPCDNSNPDFADDPAHPNSYMSVINAANKYARDNNLPIRVVTNLPPPYNPPFEFENLKGVQEISPDYLKSNFTALAAPLDHADPPWRVKSTGEPVCQIAGRAAILITDEASKVNVNVAGGHTLDVEKVLEDAAPPPTVADLAHAPVTKGYWKQTLADGATTNEYCTAVLPRVGIDPDDGSGIGRSRKMWDLLTGAPYGSLALPHRIPPTIDPEYILDTLLPGYGLVDDNGNALSLSMNGIDDDGDGIPDQGLNPAYPEYLGKFEGIDEPGELQRRQPLRNLVAEGKVPRSDTNQLETMPQDDSQTPKTMGALGDRVLRTREEEKRVVRNEAVQAPETFFDPLRNFVTLHSTDKNTGFLEAKRSGAGLTPPIPTAGPECRPQGLKVNYNVAGPTEIANALRENWALKSPTSNYVDPLNPTVPTELGFATGLQQEGVTYLIDPPIAPDGFGGQLFRSPIHFLTDDTPPVPATELDGVTPVAYYADKYLRALQLGANLHDARDPDYARTEATFAVDDTWWEAVAASNGQTDTRKIEYKVAGEEGIRITEMMVRPVRRVEAEMITDVSQMTLADAADPNRLWPNALSNPNFVDLAGTMIPDFDVRQAYIENDLLGVIASGIDPLTNQVDRDLVGHFQFEKYPLLDKPSPPLAGAYWYRDGFVTTEFPQSVIGSGCALVTNNRQIPVRFIPDLRNPNYSIVREVPNIVQFRFKPSPGLPPGRYYLTVNTTDKDGKPTVKWQKRDELRFCVKYAFARKAELLAHGLPLPPAISGIGDKDILQDVWSYYRSYFETIPSGTNTREAIDPFYNGPSSCLVAKYWRRDAFQRAIVGYEGYKTIDVSTIDCDPLNPTTATGWVFLPTLQDEVALPWDARIDPYEQDEGFTVTIPNYAPPNNPEQQVYLYVGICMGDDPSNKDPFDPASPPSCSKHLAINFFDFSQEPDHEWIEIENVTGHPVDVSNWEVAVGGVNSQGEVVTDDRLFMTIPDKILSDPDNPNSATVPVVMESRPPYNRLLLAVNAMDDFKARTFSQANSDDPNNPHRKNILFWNGIGTMSFSSAGPSLPREWAFFPGVTTPAIPLRDPSRLEDQATGTPFADPTWYHSHPSDGSNGDARGYPMGESAFESPRLKRRIVQLNIPGLTGPGDVSMTDPEGIGRWVLRGGVLPDYPEHDGVDNDNDNDTLMHDGVDNNSNGVDGDGNGSLAPWTSAVTPGEGVDEPNEGIDEGRYVMDAKPPYYVPMAGGFSKSPIEYGSVYFNWNNYNFPADPGSFTGTPQYLGNQMTNTPYPPEWEEFVQRRFFPGDNVVVTLFQGPDSLKRVVDRVTYTERDVINRAIDDLDPVVKNYYGPLNARPTLFEPDPASVRYVHFWPDNTMGIDFYRSLERKHHALYNGDRFGTSNRWEATDGNYDDWSHSPVLDLNHPALPDYTRFNGTPLARNAAYHPLTSSVVDPTVLLTLNRDEEDLAYLGFAPIENFDGVDAPVRADRDWTGRNAWSVQNGFYAGVAGRYSVYEGPPQPLVRQNNNEPPDSYKWQDYRFACDFEVPGLPSNQYTMNFVFRWQDMANHYALRVSGTGGASDVVTYSLVQVLNGTEKEFPIPYGKITPGPALPVGVPVSMEVSVEGNRIRASVNGVTLSGDDIDPLSAVIRRGTVGLEYEGGWPGPVLFDNVYVITRDRDKPSGSVAGAVPAPYVSITKTDSLNSGAGEFMTARYDPQGNLVAGVVDYLGHEQLDPQPTKIMPLAVVPADSGGLDRVRLGKAHPEDAKALLSLGTTDAVTLSCGAADFYLLSPSVTDFPDQSEWQNRLLPWTPGASVTALWTGPEVWRPMFLYPLTDAEVDDPYAYLVPDPANQTTIPTSLTVNNFLFKNPFLAGVIPAALDKLDSGRLLSRWPIERRAMVYATERSEITGSPQSDALFVWKAEDGIENGQYDVYIYSGGPLERLIDSNTAYGEYHAPPPPNPPPDMLMDVAKNGLCPLVHAMPLDELKVEVEVFTDRNREGKCWKGKVPSLVDTPTTGLISADYTDLVSNKPKRSDSFGTQPAQAFNLDGYIYYKVPAVRVENNFLAVRIKNMSEAGRLVRFAGVVLTPRDRTPGRININTVETKTYQDPVNKKYYPFNALMGVPGVLFDQNQRGLAPTIDPKGYLTDYLTALPEGPRVALAMHTLPQPGSPTSLIERARMIEICRPGSDVQFAHTTYPDHWDGRYYSNITELLSAYSYFTVYPPTTGSYQLSPLAYIQTDATQQRQWFDEVMTRYSQMANLITTRSDVFEIQVTVQAGYGVDMDGDGIINYRKNDEFVTTSEKKARTVYER